MKKSETKMRYSLDERQLNARTESFFSNASFSFHLISLFFVDRFFCSVSSATKSTTWDCLGSCRFAPCLGANNHIRYLTLIQLVQYLLVILVVGMVPSVLVHMVSGSLNWVYAVGSLAYFAWMLGFVLPQKLDNPHMDTLVNICFLCAFGLSGPHSRTKQCTKPHCQALASEHPHTASSLS